MNTTEAATTAKRMSLFIPAPLRHLRGGLDRGRTVTLCYRPPVPPHEWRDRVSRGAESAAFACSLSAARLRRRRWAPTTVGRSGSSPVEAECEERGGVSAPRSTHIIALSGND